MSGDKDVKTLNLYPIDYPFETLISRMSGDQPKLKLDPEFQRTYKWDKDGWVRASKFIESCLMRIPLPSCYFAEEDDGTQLVIDGVQRLTTINLFLNNKFALEGLTTFKELENKKFNELGKYKTELETTTIRCVVLRNDNPRGLIKEIFARLNQGAVQLSPQEVRHAIFPGDFDKLLCELADNEIIKNFKKGKAGKSKRDNREGEELVLRYFALNGDLTKYEDKLSLFLDQYMESMKDIKASEIAKLKKYFLKSLNDVVLIFESDAFINASKQRRNQSIVHYDLLMYSFSKLDVTREELLEKKKDIVKAFEDLCSLAEFERTLSGGIQNKSSILTRRRLWNTKIAEIFGRGFDE